MENEPDLQLAMPHRLFDKDYNLTFSKIVSGIYSEALGRKLLDELDFILQRGENKISFYRTASIPTNTMKYIGGFVIMYHKTILYHNQLAGGLFHELFHIFQCGVNLKQDINQEIEAYVAQCLYCKSVGENFSTRDARFTKAIKNLAGAIDLETGKIKQDADGSDFVKNYDEAFDRIIYITIYGDLEWDVALPVYSFPNIIRLLQK